ncbi:hypothetical protein SeLEV6574_g04092 [Synchytrium endobioticum]|uniref:PHD-type domain-containing protein n=1 Tax=Synchytrium endobioticum TaxID=286115 RepID=A0A507D140_9FUNG|nr:hypothetical protein SeLEV6574_g04092 [Synchytrium endobioticum]
MQMATNLQVQTNMSSPSKPNPRLKLLREETPNTPSTPGNTGSIPMGPDTPTYRELSSEEVRNSSTAGSGGALPQTPQTPGIEDGDDDVDEGDDVDDDDATAEDAEPDDASVDAGPVKKTGSTRGKRKHRGGGGFLDSGKRPRTLRTTNAKRDDYDSDWPSDAKGEDKIDMDGNLQGGRQFRLRTFTLPRHPTRHYILTMDVAKLLNFRDSYIFHMRNPDMPRIVASEADHQWLKDFAELPPRLNNRNVSLLTARAVFRKFGHRVVRHGRPVRDDYYEEGGIFQGSIPIMESDDDFTFRGDGLTRASGFMRREQRPDAPRPVFIARPIVGRDNSAMRCSENAAEFNSRLRAFRGIPFVDVHTGIDQVPAPALPPFPRSTSNLVVVQVERGTLASDNLVVEARPSVNDGKGYDKDKWISLPLSSDAYKYPLAVIPGQYQDTVSIFRTRFKFSNLEAERYEEVGWYPEDVKGGTFYCGDYITSAGRLCHRPVAAFGDICSVHKAIAEEMSPSYTDACVHCSSNIPPKAQQGHVQRVPPSWMLQCSRCKALHHPACLDIDHPVILTNIFVNNAKGLTWECNNCKTCVACSEVKDDDKLMICETCDKSYHTYCCDPPYLEIPHGPFMCTECATCTSCQAKPPPPAPKHREVEWRHAFAPTPSSPEKTMAPCLATYCNACWPHYLADRYCPFCMKVYGEESNNDESAMVCCDICDRWIHVACDTSLTEAQYQQLAADPEAKFTCSICDDERLHGLLKNKISQGRKPGHYRTVLNNGKKVVVPPLVTSV